MTRKRTSSIYINSPGGEAYSGLAIYDTMRMTNSRYPCCIVWVQSMAAVLLAGGTADEQTCLPNSRIVHQGSAGFHGNVPDIEIAGTARGADPRRKLAPSRTTARDNRQGQAGHPAQLAIT